MIEREAKSTGTAGESVEIEKDPLPPRRRMDDFIVPDGQFEPDASISLRRRHSEKKNHKEAYEAYLETIYHPDGTLLTCMLTTNTRHSLQ